MKISVIGSGSWGTALAILLCSNGHQVTMWNRSPERVAQMKETGFNTRLKDVQLPKELELTHDLSTVADSGMIVMATPSFAVRESAEAIKPYLGNKPIIVCASKGIERGTSMRLSQVIHSVTGLECAVLLGPSHAEEVGRGKPTGCVAAAESEELSCAVQDAFMNDRFRVYASSDIIGVELGSAFKNVIALAAGISDGMDCGDNAKALLMTRGLKETARLGVALGARAETFSGLSGVGDLIVTCTSRHSRNRTCGLLIGQGMTARQAMEEVGAVVEGYYAAKSAMELAEKAGVETPITAEIYRVLYEDKDPHTVVSDLMSREKRYENESYWM